MSTVVSVKIDSPMHGFNLAWQGESSEHPIWDMQKWPFASAKK